jgi:VWFA-related protein
LYSQSPAKTDSVYTLRLYEDLVIVDVVVTGKDGTPIKNLRQEYFKIFEDKIPQQIRTFDFEDLSRAIDATPRPAESTPIINLSQTPPAQLPKDALQNRRLMILMLDLSAMPAEDQIQAQHAAQSFIEKKMTPADLVAVVSNSSNLKLLQNFTNDRSALLESRSQTHAWGFQQSGGTGHNRSRRCRRQSGRSVQSVHGRRDTVQHLQYRSQAVGH